MSATTAARTVDLAPVARRVPGFGDLCRGEWTKIKTVRSTTWSLFAMVVVSLGFTVIATSVFTSSWSSLDAETKYQFTSDTIGLILQPGAQFGQLAVCVLGVLLMASEHANGMIRASVLAVPRRTPILAAKGVVFAGLVFVVSEAVAVPAFLVGSAITSEHASTSITDATNLRAIVAFGVFMALTGLIALAVGTIVRHPAGGISAVLGLQFVAPIVLSLVPGSFREHLVGALPASATVIMSSGDNSSNVYSPSNVYTPVQGLGILLVWTTVLLAVALVSLKRRDVS